MAGTIGLMTLQVLLMNGVQRVFVVDTNPERLSVAEAWGGVAINPRNDEVVKTVRQATDGRGVWAAVDAVGMAETRAQCIAATRTTGTVVFSGLHEESSSIPAADIIRREVVVRGHFAYSPANFIAAVDLLGRGQIQLGPWLLEAPLSDGGLWFERLVEGAGGLVKILLVP
jgi:threonine dehydrogenase-like Zn-dependent dehydrogenase